MRLMLLFDDFDISTSEDEKYQIVIRIAEGKADFQEIKKWIQENLKKI